MQLVIHPDAQTEILEAADWYDQRAAGLGDDFVAEVDAALNAVCEHAHVWPAWPGAERFDPPVRRYLLSRFRFYAIAYQHLSEHVLVLSVAHASRRPFYWLDRVRD